MKPVKHLLLFALLQISFALPPVKGQDKINAVIAGDFPDPSIIRAQGSYYAVATSSEWAPHFPIYRSSNLKNWTQTGYVFYKTPEWASGSFWAPEYYHIKNTYLIYYAARRKTDGHVYVGVATSKYPDKGFTDHGILVEFGKETIDPFVYNDNGQLYITFKAYGLDSRPIETMCSKLSADGLKLAGEPFSLLRDDERIGQEGQSILKNGKYYYLFYASGNCCGSGCSYNVRVARATNFKGPYEKYAQNPLLTGGGEWKCTGHGTFVRGGDGKTYYLHHAYRTNNDVFTGREGLLALLTWPNNNGWPKLTDIQEMGKANNDIKASFQTEKIAPYWQWDFRNATPVIKQGGGKLTLSGTIKENNQTGIALTVRPTSDNFVISTTVANSNAALKGLAFYGDAEVAMGVTVSNNKVELWVVKDKKREVLSSAEVTAAPIGLKFSMQPDKTCRAFYRQGIAGWIELTNAASPLDISFLPQWDRSPRPGLLFKGDAGSSAEFSSFEMVNR